MTELEAFKRASRIVCLADYDVWKGLFCYVVEHGNDHQSHELIEAKTIDQLDVEGNEENVGTIQRFVQILREPS